MSKIVLKLKRDSKWEEYQVQWWEDGVLNTDKTYHTDDLQDAKDTQAAMQKKLDIGQHQRLDQTSGDRLNIPLPKKKS